MIIDVVNLSTRVTEREARAMVAACSLQLTQHYASDWGYLGMGLNYVGSSLHDVTAAVARGHIVIALLDAPDQPDALGYHNLVGGIPAGKVFASPVLDNGGTVLGVASNPGGYSVSGTLSHEVLEVAGDAFVNWWAEDSTGREVSLELSDPVEACGYMIDVADPADPAKTVSVAVSDFVLPEWFNPQSQHGPWSHLDRVAGPFQMAPGGYLIIRKGGPGTEEQVFADRASYPEWKLAGKGHALSRTSLRGVSQ